MARLNQKHVSKLIQDCLRRGTPVEIEGFGTFNPQPDGDFDFVAVDSPRVFISYATEDVVRAGELFDQLAATGFNPWMDRRNLNAGQNWPRLIEAAIETTDFFLACMSSNSVSKRGAVQAEIRYALDIAQRLPLEDTFIIPVRFDECHVPVRISRAIQYIDLFPDPDPTRLIQAMQKQWRKRRPAKPTEPKASS